MVERPNGGSPRLGLSLLKLVNGSLRQTNPTTKFTLAPTENRPCQPDLGGKGLSVEQNVCTETMRTQ